MNHFDQFSVKNILKNGYETEYLSHGSSFGMSLHDSDNRGSIESISEREIMMNPINTVRRVG